MKVRLPEFCVKKTPQSSCSPFFLTEYIQIDKLIIKKKKTIVKDTIKISPAVKISTFFCDIFSFCHFAQSCGVIFVHIYHFCVSQRDCLTPAFFSYSPPFLCNHSNFFIKQFSRCVKTKYLSRIMIYPVFNIGYFLG